MIATLNIALWGKDGSAVLASTSARKEGDFTMPLHLIVRNHEGQQILDLALWDGAEEVLFAAVDEYRRINFGDPKHWTQDAKPGSDVIDCNRQPKAKGE